MSEIERVKSLPPMDFAEWYYSINKKLDKLTKALDSIAEDILRVKILLPIAISQKGTPTRKSMTASGEVVAAPSSGQKLQVLGYFLSVDADEIVRLRYGGATGEIFAELPTKGVIAMNLLGINEAGGDAENIYLEKTGTGNARVVVYTEVVST